MGKGPNFVIVDECSVMVATGNHIFKKAWKNSMWFVCWSRNLHGIGGIMKAIATLNNTLSVLFRSAGLMQPSTQASRRRRWRSHQIPHKTEKIIFPP